ncbi:MAG: MFS transporter [Deltaproteobacteria bacterium]|nr:MFS transporter [Deltaproteobacteria bacterium]
MTSSQEEYPFWRRNMAALALGNFCNTAGFSTYYPFLPMMVLETGTEMELETAVGLLVGLFFLMSTLLGPVWGAFADHYGRRSMVLRAGFGMSAGFALMNLAPSLGWFIPLFMLVGITNGYVPAALSLAAANTPQKKMGLALSTLQTGSVIGVSLGPALGAYLASLLPSYRDLFWVSSAASFTAGLAALLLVRERHVRPREPFRVHLIADSLVILRQRGLGLLMFLSFLFNFTFFGSTPVVALLVIEMAGGAREVDGLRVDTWVGVTTLSMTVASTLALPVWGRLLDRYEPARLLMIGLGLTALVLLTFPLAGSYPLLVAARLALGAVVVVVQPGVVGLIKELAPPGMDGRAIALGSSMMMLGYGAAPVLAGIMGPWLGLRFHFILNAALVGLGFLLWARRGIPIADRQKAG